MHIANIIINKFIFEFINIINKSVLYIPTFKKKTKKTDFQKYISTIYFFHKTAVIGIL